VVRLAGNKEEEGRRILLENGLDFYESMDGAAKKAVELSKC
jgi:succinyl-CoA synthetase beta subunit